MSCKHCDERDLLARLVCAIESLAFRSRGELATKSDLVQMEKRITMNFQEAMAALTAVKTQLTESTGTITTAIEGVSGDVAHLKQLLEQGGQLTQEQQAALDAVVTGFGEVSTAMATAASALTALDAQTPPPG